MRRLLKSLARICGSFAIKLGLVSIKILPRCVFLFLARAGAGVGYYLFHRFRNRSIRNLRLALGEQLDSRQIGATVRGSLTNFFRDFVEIGFAFETPPQQIRADIPLYGREHLEAALAKKKGAIALSAHMGNFFLVGTRLSAEGYTASVLVNQPPDGYFGRFMDRCRLHLGQRTIHARPRRRAFRELVQALRRNEIAIVIADEYRSGNGVFVPFFGHTVVARRGPATLALRTGAPLIPMALVRGADGKLKLVIEPEIEVAQSGAIKADVRETTLRIAKWLQKTVSAHPDQWNWMNVRWHRASAGDRAGKEPRCKGPV